MNVEAENVIKVVQQFLYENNLNNTLNELIKETNVNYNLIVIINNIGICPLSFYSNIIIYLNELSDIFSNHLISCCFLCKDNGPIKILKPLFSAYKFIRPYKICHSYEDVLQFFNK